MWRWISLAAVVLVIACVEKDPPGKKIDPAYVEANILSEPPASMDNTVNADLGGKVVYLGNDVSTDTIAPGQAFTVTHYWKIVEPPGERWNIFSHVVGAGKSNWMNVDHTDMRVGHPASKWKAGQIIRDEQKISLRREWTSPYAQVVVGLYPKGASSAAERMPIVSGPHDAEHRVLAAKFQVSGAAKGESPRGYVVRRASGPIEIDGKADEDDWKRAQVSSPFSPTEGGEPLEAETTARLLYDDENLYAFVDAADDDVFSEYVERDDSLWKADVIELFIDADGNRRGYVELQVNPNNAQLDAWFATTRAQQGDFAFDAKMTSAVDVRGTADNRGDDDEGWSVEVAIPLVAVKGHDDAMAVNIPPRPGDTWKLNIVRVDRPEGKQIRASSWSPITIQDFHALDRMLTVTFGDASGQVPAAKPAQGHQVAPVSKSTTGD